MQSFELNEVNLSIESFNFVSHKGRISGEFESRKDSHALKSERSPRLLLLLVLFRIKLLTNLIYQDNSFVCNAKCI